MVLNPLNSSSLEQLALNGLIIEEQLCLSGEGDAVLPSEPVFDSC